MADIYSTDLPVKATEIRNEPDDGENTATRVGDMFLSIIDYISRNEEDWLRDTGGTGLDQLQLPVGLTGLLGSLSTVSDIPSGQNKILVWKNADANPNGWGYLTTPTGGTGTGNGDVTWSQLTTTALQGHQIDGSHLANALSNYLTNAKLTNTGANASKYTWWGRYLTPSTSGGVTNYKVEGPLSGGITYIQFSNGVRIESIAGTETTSPALRVVDANTTAGTADFYAMGGVSALGRSGSSSGGGGDTPVVPTDLGAILNHVKNNTASVNPVPNPIPEGATIRWNGDDAWVVDKTTWGDLGAVAPSFTDNRIDYLLKCSTSNGGNSYSYEWIPITSSSGNVTKLSNVGDVAAYNPSADGILAYVNGVSELEKWQYKRFLINPSQDVTYDGSPVSLTSIILGGTKYNVPTYTIASLMGNSTIGSSTQPIYWDGSDFQTIGYEINKTVPANAVFTDHIYTNGNGLDLNSGTGAFSVKATGGLTVDGDGVKIDPSTNKRILWGNQDTLTNDIGKSGENNTRSLDYVLNISMYGGIVMNSKNSQIQMADPEGTTRNVLNLTDKNQKDAYYGNAFKAFLDVGYGCARVTTGDNKSALRLWGNDILFKANGSDNNNRNTMILTKEGSTYLPLATTGPKEGNTYTGAGPTAGLRIGDAVLYWDEKNQALALAKYNASQPSSPTAANFYATGGVSALGMSSGSGSVGAMTFNNLTVDGTLTISDEYVSHNISINQNDLFIDCGADHDIVLNSNVYANRDFHLSYTKYLYLSSKWRLGVTDNTQAICVLEYNIGSSSTPNWQPKGTWSAS